MDPSTSYRGGGTFVAEIAWYKTTLHRSQFDSVKGLKGACHGVPRSGPGERSFSSGDKEWDKRLGTISDRNHFVEIQVVQESSVANQDHGFCRNDVDLFIYSESRGYGDGILKRYTVETCTRFVEGRANATKYTKEQDKSCQWAKTSRNLSNSTVYLHRT
ncbi:hypothetical protein BDW02DRAFT_605363 [Decorospora gaudefroyi]|uniref:3'-phosphate/5'-hydroxy nucleic acid ligase n=1 Tax=Decorospora gaudefroyi TaxID=184978 RepID=A0A6A5K3R4_9PLEO|nr:hypothetical protein BDW02DRAFT_605363 [Decorospora gaudefroyi]